MSEANLKLFLAYVKSILQISDNSEDTALNSYILSAYFFIAEQTGIYFIQPETTPETFLHDGAWNRTIFLRKRPITERVSLEYNAWTQATPDWVVVDEDEYTIDSQNWKLIYEAGFPRWFRNLQLKYTYGYNFADIPQEFEKLKFAVAKITWLSRDLVAIGAVKSETVSGTTIQYTKEYLESGVQQILDLYYNPSI